MSLEKGKPSTNESPESFREISEKMRDVLFGEPSKENLSNILNLISVAKEISPESRQISIQYAVDHLKSWPDELRLCDGDSEPSWENIFINGKDADLAVLFRNLNLRRKNLFYKDKIRHIFSSEEIRNIKILSLEGVNLNVKIMKELRYLTESTKLSQLEVLNVSNNELTEIGANELVKSASFPDLKELNLASSFLMGFQSAKEELGRTEVVKNKGKHILRDVLVRFERLQSLDLGGNYIGEGLIQMAVESGQVYRLQKLNLDYSNLGPLDVDLLAKSKSFSNLRELSLRHNDIGIAGAESLAKSEILSMEVKRGLVNQKVISEELARENGIIT